MEKNEKIIEVSNLDKIFKTKRGYFKAVDEISFEIEKGKIYGFVGPNGAGKTTTIKMLVGLARPSSGEIKIKNKKINSLSVKKILGYVPEKPVIYGDMLPLDYLIYLAELSGVSKKNAIELAEYYIDLFGLKDSINKKIGDYSSGMKQKILIAQALMHNPEILILDEPTNALDPLGQDQIMAILKHLSTKNKITIIVSSHHLKELEGIIDNIIVIDKGKIVMDSEVEDIKEKAEEQLEIKVTNSEKVAELLKQTFDLKNIIIEKNKIKLSDPRVEKIRKKIVQAIVESGEELMSIHTIKKSLWDEILKILKK